jgi:RNA polymerase sigma-70 factor, ECF subfamily
MDEAELIARARMRDQDAFTELHRLHIRYVWAIGRSILHSHELEDFCQEVFLLAFTRLPSFDEQAQFRTWLTRIAVNRCLLMLRQERQASNGARHLVQLDAGFSAPDKYLEAVPDRLELNKIMQRLTPLQRRVLEMAYLEHLPGQEIATILGTTPAAVKNKIYDAKERLREFDR